MTMSPPNGTKMHILMSRGLDIFDNFSGGMPGRDHPSTSRASGLTPLAIPKPPEIQSPPGWERCNKSLNGLKPHGISKKKIMCSRRPVGPIRKINAQIIVPLSGLQPCASGSTQLCNYLVQDFEGSENSIAIDFAFVLDHITAQDCSALLCL